jgi:hypothetical protein
MWGGELYSIKELFRIVIRFWFPYCSKKFIPNLKSWIFYSEVINSCAGWFLHCFILGGMLDIASLFIAAQYI